MHNPDEERDPHEGLDADEELDQVTELRRQLAEAREAHRIIALRLNEYESSRPAKAIGRFWAFERTVRDFAIRRRLQYRSVQRRLGRPVHHGGGTDIPQTSLGENGLPRAVTFPSTSKPDVSIVVPMHGQLEATVACLSSIATAKTDVSFEVIAVDDASTDRTAEWLDTCTGLHVVALRENVGYLRATNTGAAAARGTFICLLNNDTLVTDRWLDALVASFQQHDNVGAVGAKLVYPNGEVQEGGGVVWADASGHNMGRGGSRDEPAIGFVRDVDYCSAACLLVDAEVWRELGGFDERYAPAYYEDTDLAFAIRASGRRVLYQPAAEIVHAEGTSHGSDISTGLKAHQAINRTSFAEKWATELTQQPTRGTHPEQASWRGDKVLVVADHKLPEPDADSGSLRMSLLLDLLARKGHRVIFVAADETRREPYATQLEQRGIRLAFTTSDVEHVLRVFSDHIDVCVLSRPGVAEQLGSLVKRHAPSATVAYDMVDFHALRLERQQVSEHKSTAAQSVDASQMVEDQMLRSADIVIAVSDEEADLVRAMRPNSPTIALPNIHAVPRSIAQFENRSGVLFVGNWRHAPNRDAIVWLRDEIMPLVWKLDATIELHVVGTEVPQSIGNNHPKIEVHGWVPYLEPLFDRVRVSVAPLRFGAGLKGKVGDSLARGVPVVTTNVGAEGFGPVQACLAIAETAQEIADEIVRLHADRDEWIGVGDAGVSLVNAHFGRQRAQVAVDELLEAAQAIRLEKLP